MHWITKPFHAVTIGLGLLALTAAGYFSAGHPSKALAAEPSAPASITAPQGTRISVRLDQSVSSKSAPGSSFAATVVAPVVVDGQTVIPSGARAVGRVVDAKQAGRLKGRARVSLALDSVQVGEKSYPLETTANARTGRKHVKRNAISIGGGAGVGALIGGVAAGPVGMLIGSGAGAGAGTIYACATGKKQVVLAAETRLNFELEQPVEFAVRR